MFPLSEALLMEKKNSPYFLDSTCSEIELFPLTTKLSLKACKEQQFKRKHK